MVWGPNGWRAILLVNCNPGDTGRLNDQSSEEKVVKEMQTLYQMTVEGPTSLLKNY